MSKNPTKVQNVSWAESAPASLPVRVVVLETVVPRPPTIEIVRPSGPTVRVPEGFDPRTLGAAHAELATLLCGSSSARDRPAWIGPGATPAPRRGLLRSPAQEATASRDLLGGYDPDRVTVQSQPGDQPGVVVGRLVDATILDAADRDLPGEEAAGRVPDPDKGIVAAAENWVHRSHGMDAVADQQVGRGADGTILDDAALEDAVDPERSLVDIRRDHEGSPQRDALVVGIDGTEGLVQVEVDARLGEWVPDPDLKGLREPTDRVRVQDAVVRVGALADGADEGRPGVGIAQQLRMRLRTEDQDVVAFGRGDRRCRRGQDDRRQDGGPHPSDHAHGALPIGDSLEFPSRRDALLECLKYHPRVRLVPAAGSAARCRGPTRPLQPAQSRRTRVAAEELASRRRLLLRRRSYCTHRPPSQPPAWIR